MDIERLLNKMRDQLYARGDKQIRSIGRAFRIMQVQGHSRVIDPSEFFIAMRDFGCNFTKQEAVSLMKYLDKNGNGSIDYDQFLQAVRGRPNARRQIIIDKAYLKFDKNCDGKISALDLKGVYNTSMNPKVRSGTMTEEQVFLEFLQNFGDVNHDGCITRQEWNDYYSTVSASIDDDQHFILLMKIAWKLND